MKKILLTLVMLAGVQGHAATEKLKVDTKESKLEWVGKKVTGQHNGTIALQDGTVEFKDNKLVAAQFTIDMTQIVNVDVKDPVDNGKLIGHLKSEDFFSTEKFNQAKLVVKSVKNLSPTKAEVTADVTIRGKTNPVTFPVDYKFEGKTATASGKMILDRTKFDVKYNSGKFFDVKKLGDKLINDEFELSFNLKAMGDSKTMTETKTKK